MNKPINIWDKVAIQDKFTGKIFTLTFFGYKQLSEALPASSKEEVNSRYVLLGLASEFSGVKDEDVSVVNSAVDTGGSNKNLKLNEKKSKKEGMQEVDALASIDDVLSIVDDVKADKNKQ